MRARCRSAFIVVEQMCGLADKLLEHLRADWDMQNDENSSLTRVPRCEGGIIFTLDIYFKHCQRKHPASKSDREVKGEVNVL